MKFSLLLRLAPNFFNALGKQFNLRWTGCELFSSKQVNGVVYTNHIKHYVCTATMSYQPLQEQQASVPSTMSRSSSQSAIEVPFS